MRISCFIILMMISLESFCQSPDMLKVRKWREQQESAMVQEFIAFLAIPNIAADSPNMHRNAAFIKQLMETRKIGHVQLLTGDKAGYPPALYGEVLVPGAKQTIGFYAHYDGQPVNPAQWATGLSPFTPVLYDRSLLEGGKPIPFPSGSQEGNKGYNPEWRIYSRSASDDKAGVFAILNAYAALAANGLRPACNLKFLFEGEEEAGSIHLDDIFETHADLLKTDCWVICDGPVHQSG
ncbi:MAG TPA: M20/M25/M40 family metallo-hydrolase, partial [Puia sp.]|nr:M20/M25/M40 family metallo-hydrolase [Puia sp.]